MGGSGWRVPESSSETLRFRLYPDVLGCSSDGLVYPANLSGRVSEIGSFHCRRVPMVAI